MNKPRSIGFVAGGGGPVSAAALFKSIIDECQSKYGACKSSDYPLINLYSYPYSQSTLTTLHSDVPSQELTSCIQQLVLIGMQIVVIPCFTISSYLTFRNYGIELIEMGSIVGNYLQKNNIKNPLVLCTKRTKKSKYCEQFFECHYPSDAEQEELMGYFERASKGEKIDIRPFLDRVPKDMPVVCASNLLNVQIGEVDDPRWVNPNKLLVEYLVYRSYNGILEDEYKWFHFAIHENQKVNNISNDSSLLLASC